MDGKVGVSHEPDDAPDPEGAAPAPLRIRRLSDQVVNRIAAGEVVERPASVVKELVENALDAGAGRIEVTTAAGGKTLIRVADDGHGMDREDLELAVCRHCTSKLLHERFSAIRTLGFRGEALPSIAAVARLSIATRRRDGDAGWQIRVTGGEGEPVRPSARPAGTLVEVRDLFFATPARLKFLKADRTEAGAVADAVRRLALAHPAVRFSLHQGERSAVTYPAAADLAGRARAVLGEDFAADALALEAVREGIALSGLVGTPATSRPNGDHVFLFVNGRPVKDRALTGAVRAGYQDVLPRDRYPVVAIDIAADPALVDVNVHPAKTEVRFRDAALVRGLLVSAVRARLAGAGGVTLGGEAIPLAPRPESAPRAGRSSAPARPVYPKPAFAPPPGGFHEPAAPRLAGLDRPSARTDAGAARAPDAGGEGRDPSGEDHPLGAAVAHVHGNYILAESRTGLVVVDAHAAHERIVYEKLKAERRAGGVAAQTLMVPEVVEMPPDRVERLVAEAEALSALGLLIEAFGPGAVAVRAVPAMLPRLDVRALLADLSADLDEDAHVDRLDRLLDRAAATIACHGSVRSGRTLRPEEMNALLRAIEATPNAARCNHGRPTYVTLDLAAVEKLFMRR